MVTPGGSPSSAGAWNGSSRNLRTQPCPQQQRRRAEPAASGNQSQDQRRHPLRAGHRQQDDLGIPLWHLAGQRSQSPPGMPPVARFPSNLNTYAAGSPQALHPARLGGTPTLNQALEEPMPVNNFPVEDNVHRTNRTERVSSPSGSSRSPIKMGSPSAWYHPPATTI